MMRDFKIFIGYDQNQSEAAQVCAESIHRFTGNEVPINFIDKDKLHLKNLYWRAHDPCQSTDFAFTRFLTPYLAGYYGTALFCDSDFLWRKDPREILQYQNKNVPVQVVQHQLTPDDAKPTKMGGKVQTFYPKKNWSSLMMFNMGGQYSRNILHSLDPSAVSEESAAFLHGFGWSPYMDPMDSLPKSFNHLIGYKGYDDPDPVAVHFTDGGPWHGEKYKKLPFASEWLALADRMGPHV
jgi:hypothetical protein